MPRKTKPKFDIGERVAEKPKATFISNISKDKIEIVVKNSTQRYGKVVDVLQKVGTNKQRMTYYKVAWDNNTVSQHAQFRLCKESELPIVIQNYRNAIGL